MTTFDPAAADKLSRSGCPGACFKGSRVLALALLAGALSLSGCCFCATQTYDVQAYNTWANLEKGLHEQPTPVDAEQTGVSIQLPRLFAAAGSSQAKAFRPGGEAEGVQVPKLRVQPPQVELPGMRFSYESYYPAEEGNLPVYVYLAILPAGEAERDQAMQQIQEAVAASGAASATWETKDLGELGDTKPVRYMSVTGTQEFLESAAVAGQKGKEVPGRLDLYLESTPYANILVGWRAPDSIANDISFFEAAEAAMKTVKSEKPAPNPVEGETPAEEAPAETGGESTDAAS